MSTIELHKHYLVCGNYCFYYKYIWMPISPYVFIILPQIISFWNYNWYIAIPVLMVSLILVTWVVWAFVLNDETLFAKITGWHWESNDTTLFVLKCHHVLEFYKNKRNILMPFVFKPSLNTIMILNNNDLMHLKLTFDEQKYRTKLDL